MKYTDIKTFTLKDPENKEKTVEVEMTVGQRIELRMMEALINQLTRLKK